MFGMMQAFSQFRNDPAQMLLKSGRITQEQYKAVSGMSPSQMGQYLLNNGVIGGDQFGQLKQNVPQFSNMLNGTNGQ